MYFCIGKYYIYTPSRGKSRIMCVTGIGKITVPYAVYYRWIDNNMPSSMTFNDAACVFKEILEEDLELMLLAGIT
jgi:hypothetical protein